MITTGKELTTAADISSPYTGSPVDSDVAEKRSRAIAGVWVLWLVKTLAKSTSFQPTRKANTKATTTAGRATGNSTRHSAPRWLHPSTRAASSSSLGTDRR